jgi:hypothetical protein
MGFGKIGSCVLFSTGCGIFHGNMANTKCGMDDSLNLRALGLWSAGVAVLLIAALGTGCARSGKHKEEEPPAPVTGIPAPKPPTFLNGAMAVLLTNLDGFRARVVLERPAVANESEIVSGELMGRAGKLLFAPEPSAQHDKYSRAEDFSYIWDVDESRGFLLSGPLQAYAPISSSTRFTNIVAAPSVGNSAQEKVSGYLCQKTEVRVIASDGEERVFQVWRAKDLKGMPVRIACTVNGKPLTVALSRIRIEIPPTELFAPPTDFTKYSSAETMMTELVARQQNIKHKRGWEPPPTDEIGFRDANAPGHSR